MCLKSVKLSKYTNFSTYRLIHILDWIQQFYHYVQSKMKNEFYMAIYK